MQHLIISGPPNVALIMPGGQSNKNMIALLLLEGRLTDAARGVEESEILGGLWIFVSLHLDVVRLKVRFSISWWKLKDHIKQ